MSLLSLSPSFDDYIRNVYSMLEIRSLEKTAIEIYDSIPYDYQELRDVLEARRNLLNVCFCYHEESAKFVGQFNELLSNVIIKSQKRCNDDQQRLSFECPEKEPEVFVYIGFLEIPECHPYKGWVKNEWGETVWDVITDADVENLWDRWNDSFLTIKASESPINELELLGLSDKNDNWAETSHLPKLWAKGMKLTMQFHQLYCHSYMSLFDLMFVDKFQIELSHKTIYKRR